nr:hypothetical protein [Tanacetum cinerariifolium]
MYVSGHVDMFNMVAIDLFTIIALNMMVLKLGYTGESDPMFYNYLRPLTSLDVGLYALACEEDVRCLATLVRSFKLIEVYIKHGVTVLDSYLRAPRFRETLEDITDEPAGSIAANRLEKMLLLTRHESSETNKEPVYDSVTPSSLPQHDSSNPCKDSVCESITPRCKPGCILTPPTDESVITYTQLSGAHGVIDDVMMQLSFDETKLDGEAGLVNVAESGMDSSGLSHDESFEVDDLDLNLNEPVNLNVSQVETQSELPVSEEPDVDPTQEPILAEVSTQEPSVAKVSTQEPIMAEGNGQEDESASTEGQFFYDDEGIYTAYKTKYNVKSSEDAGTYDDDVDEVFLVDEENEIVEPDVDVYLFGISMDLLFDNIGITNLFSDNVLEGEGVNVINADGQIRARCERKVHVFTMSQCTGPTGLYSGIEARLSGSSGPTTKSKKRKNIGTNDDSQTSFYFLDAHDKGDVCPWVLYVGKDKFTQNWVMKTHKDTHTYLQSREIKHCTYKFLSETISEQVRVNPDIPVKAVQDQLQRELEFQISMSKAFRAKAKAEREIRGYHVLQYFMLRDYVVELQSTNPNTTIKIAVERNIDPSLPTRVFQRINVCLGALKLGFRAFRRDLLGLDGAFMNGSFVGQVLCLGDDIDLHSNLTFTFISDRQKGIIPAITTVYPSAEYRWGEAVITLLEYIREYCMKRIVNVQGVIDKCIGPLTPTATRIMESIKKEAHLMKVQWNEANKHQVSGSLADQCVVDVVSMTCSCRKWELTGISCKHAVADYWNMALNNRGTPPSESWERKNITCQSCENIGHNKATCKGQGRKATIGGNNAEGSGSASRQAQQTKPVVGQDGSGGSGAGAIIGLSAVGGEGGAHDPGGAGVASQAINDNSKFLMDDEEEVTSNKLAPLAEEMIMLIEVSDLVWYNEEIREHVEKLADVLRTTISYFFKKAVKKYADDE